MSHVVGGKVVFKNLDYLEEACRQLGLVYHRNKVNWRWYGRWVNDYHDADAAYKLGVDVSNYGKANAGIITMPDCNYDIGIYKMSDGTYSAVYDFYGEGAKISDKLGRNLEKLSQKYAEVATKAVLKKYGYKVFTTKTKSNVIHLRGVK